MPLAMSDSTLMTRYLLGELTDEEQSALEARYFEDARVFDALTDVENALVDDYVRGRMAADTRQRFETCYLAHPKRRERVTFAAALAKTLDRHADADDGNVDPHVEWSGWRARLHWVRGRRLAIAFAMLIFLVAGTWLIIDARRTSVDTIATTPQVEDQSAREGTPTPAPFEPAPSAPPAQPVLAVATLTLTVGPGERSAGATVPPTLTLSPGTDRIRLVLRLREHDSVRYRVIVRAIGCENVVRQVDLVPNTSGTTPTFTLTLPASRLQPGDYMLTLQGAGPAREFEDLSQTLFRVR